jgi:flagellar basal-body rod protein FlgG
MYMAGSGMMFNRLKMETITNNITNADTVGYKRDNLVAHSFDDVMIRTWNDYGQGYDAGFANGLGRVVGTQKLVGPMNFGVQVDQIHTDFTMGNIEETGKSTDLLLTGNGYFVLDTPQGERYSKAGAFTLNSLGYLTDGTGHYVMGTDGAVFVGTDNFRVGEDGTVTVGEEAVNRLRIVGFEDEGQLRKQGDNLFFDAGNANPTDMPENTQVIQGFYENSNVDAAREMVDMMTTYRAYETNQKMVTMIDEINGKAVNELGRLR